MTLYRRLNRTLPFSWEHPESRSPVKFKHNVRRVPPLQVDVWIGGSNSAGRRATTDGKFQWHPDAEWCGELRIYWGEAALPLLVHESTHVGQWAVRYATKHAKLATLVDRGMSRKRSVEAMKDELGAYVAEDFFQDTTIALANAGVSLPPFEWAEYYRAVKLRRSGNGGT